MKANDLKWFLIRVAGFFLMFALVSSVGIVLLTWSQSGKSAGRLVSYPSLAATVLWFVVVVLLIIAFQGFRAPVLADADRRQTISEQKEKLKASRAETDEVRQEIERIRLAVREGLVLRLMALTTGEARLLCAWGSAALELGNWTREDQEVYARIVEWIGRDSSGDIPG